MSLFRRLGLTAVLAMALILTLRVQASAEEGSDVELRGWMDAGTVSHLMDIGRRPRDQHGITTSFFSSSKEVRGLAHSADTLWIGTEGGLFAWSASYDSIISIEGPAFHGITALEVDESGHLWVGGDDGISIRRGGRWFHYDRLMHPFFNRITGFFGGHGRMWLTTFGSGCGYFEADSLTVLSRADSLLDDRVLGVIEQDDDQVWFGTMSGLCHADSFRWQAMRYGNRIPMGAVKSMAMDEEGKLFLAVDRRGVAVYSLGRVSRYVKRDGLPGLEINTLDLDRTGKVWAAGRGGVSTWGGSGWSPVRIEGVSLAYHNFISICHDVDGNTYLGTDEGRIVIVSYDTMREIDLPQQFPLRGVSSIRIYGDEKYFISGSKVYRSTPDATAPVLLPDPWYDGAVTGLVRTSGGDIWISSRFGILHYNGSSWEVFDRRLGLPSDNFIWVERGEGNDLWFGTFESGILRLNAGGWTHFNDMNGLPSNTIKSLATDGSGDAWVLAGSGSVARLSSDGWQQFQIPMRGGNMSVAQVQDTLSGLDPGIRFLGTGEGPGSQTGGSPAVGLTVDNTGACVVCRTDGIYRFSPAGWQVIDLPYTGRRLIPATLIVTERGEIWLGTIGSGLFIRRSGAWIHLDALRGLSGDDVRALAEDRYGRVWAGTRSGGVTVCQYIR